MKKLVLALALLATFGSTVLADGDVGQPPASPCNPAVQECSPSSLLDNGEGDLALTLEIALNILTAL